MIDVVLLRWRISHVLLGQELLDHYNGQVFVRFCMIFSIEIQKRLCLHTSHDIRIEFLEDYRYSNEQKMRLVKVFEIKKYIFLSCQDSFIYKRIFFISVWYKSFLKT